MSELIFRIECFINKIQTKINNFLIKRHKPQYSTGDLVKCVVGNSLVAFRIQFIEVTKYGPAYRLVGEGIVIDGKVSHLEIPDSIAYTCRLYTPFCKWFDEDSDRKIG